MLVTVRYCKSGVGLNVSLKLLKSIVRVQKVLLTFQGSSEQFHWSVIDAPHNTGHTLNHFVVIQELLKAQGGVYW